MPSITGMMSAIYHIGRLTLTGIWGLAYAQWRIWRAKYVFRRELSRNGVPKESIGLLVSSYDAQNKKLLGPLVSFAHFRRWSKR